MSKDKTNAPLVQASSHHSVTRMEAGAQSGSNWHEGTKKGDYEQKHTKPHKEEKLGHLGRVADPPMTHRAPESDAARVAEALDGAKGRKFLGKKGGE